MTSLCRPGLISILAAVQYISSATKLQAEIEQKKKLPQTCTNKSWQLGNHADSCRPGLTLWLALTRTWLDSFRLGLKASSNEWTHYYKLAILWWQATNDAMNVLNIAQTCRSLSTYTTKLYHFHLFLFFFEARTHWIDSTNNTNIESSHNFAKHMLHLLSRIVCTRLQLLDKSPAPPLLSS